MEIQECLHHTYSHDTNINIKNKPLNLISQIYVMSWLFSSNYTIINHFFFSSTVRTMSCCSSFSWIGPAQRGCHQSKGFKSSSFVGPVLGLIFLSLKIFSYIKFCKHVHSKLKWYLNEEPYFMLQVRFQC